MTKIICHRGYSAKFPENTLTSFKAAVELGVDKIELDVHHSLDHKLVVHHHSLLEYPAGGEGLIADKPYSYIASLDAGTWFDEKFKSEHIPLLEEVFDAIGSRCEYEIELKGLDETFIKDVVRLVRERDLFDKVEFTSGNLFMLSTLRTLEPTASIGMFVPKFARWMTEDFGQRYTLSQLTLGKISVAHCPLEILNEQFITELKNKGFQVHAADCNTEENIRRAITLNVDQFSTNEVERAIQIRKDLKNSFRRLSFVQL